MEDNTEDIVILIADDDEEDRMLACDALIESRLGNQILSVVDGEDLMAYLYHEGKYLPPAEAPRPGMILLDLNMPKKDGREALRDIKSDPKLRSIPIVVLTTSKDEEDMIRSYDLGAHLFLSKPVTFLGLVAVMKGLNRYWFKIVDEPRKQAQAA